MATRELQTTEAVINALGGPAATARLTQRKSQHVWNWKSTGRFPADTYLVISEELKAKDKIAPPALWGIREPEQAAAS